MTPVQEEQRASPKEHDPKSIWVCLFEDILMGLFETRGSSIGD